MDDILSFLDNDRRMILIVGMSGSGKTTLVKDALTKHGTTYITPSYNDYKQFEECVDNFVNSAGFSFFSTNGKRVVFLDDVENLFSQHKQAKVFISSVLAGKNLDCKFVMTCSASEEKRIEIDYKIDYCVVRLPENKNTNAYRDRDIYAIVFNIFRNYKECMLDLYHALSSDAILISFMMYDNVGLFLPSAADTMNPIYKSYLQMSLLERYAFKNNDWDILHLYTLVQCGMIRYMQKHIHLVHEKEKEKEKDKEVGGNKSKKKGKEIIECDNLLTLEAIGRKKQSLNISASKIAYTQIPNKASQRYCLMKKKYDYMMRNGLSETMLLEKSLTESTPFSNVIKTNLQKAPKSKKTNMSLYNI